MDDELDVFGMLRDSLWYIRAGEGLSVNGYSFICLGSCRVSCVVIVPGLLVDCNQEL